MNTYIIYKKKKEEKKKKKKQKLNFYKKYLMYNIWKLKIKYYYFIFNCTVNLIIYSEFLQII